MAPKQAVQRCSRRITAHVAPDLGIAGGPVRGLDGPAGRQAGVCVPLGGWLHAMSHVASVDSGEGAVDRVLGPYRGEVCVCVVSRDGPWCRDDDHVTPRYGRAAITVSTEEQQE